MTMQDRERDRRSLQDLAKMALTPPPPSVSVPSGPNSASGVQRAGEAKDDSGIVDLAAAAASDPQGAERAKSTALASAGLFDDEPQSVRPGAVAQPVPTIPPMPASIPPSVPPAAHPATLLAPVATPMPVPVSAVPAALAPVASVASVAPEAAPAKKGGKLVAVVFGLFAVSAVAAGTFVFLKGQKAAHEGTVAMNDKTTATPTPVAKADPPPAETAAPAPSEPGTGLDALPTASPADAKIAGKHPRTTGRPGAAGPAAAKPAAPEAKEDPKVAQKDIAAAPTGPAGALGDEMRKAVGASDPTPAAGPAGATGPAAGSVPQKPSQGAITGALGAVLPEARRCLGPDDPISRASVVFGSNGTVQSVNVSGGAAGKPAEACIKGALLKAKVAPFAEAQYSAPVTIRH